MSITTLVRRPCTRALPALLAALVAIALNSSVSAQDAQSKTPEPEDIALETKDKVALKATFYPSTLGKEAIPVIMLHMYKGSRVDYHDLALALQAEGHAVLVPDLRGHGESTRYTDGDEKITVDRMNRAAFAAMVAGDVEACKTFLRDQNNEEQLNIDKLCLVGAEMGAIVALNWAALDWAWPPLPRGKQGQDVKALVLLSPAWTIKGFSVNPAMASPAVQSDKISIYILTDKKAADAKRLEKTLAKTRANSEEKSLIMVPLETSLAGTKMLEVPELEVAKRISKFIELKVVKKTIPWKDRSLR